MAESLINVAMFRGAYKGGATCVMDGCTGPALYMPVVLLPPTGLPFRKDAVLPIGALHIGVCEHHKLMGLDPAVVKTLVGVGADTAKSLGLVPPDVSRAVVEWVELRAMA